MNNRLNFEDFDFEELAEIEEIITPAQGVSLCCSA